MIFARRRAKEYSQGGGGGRERRARRVSRRWASWGSPTLSVPAKDALVRGRECVGEVGKSRHAGAEKGKGCSMWAKG